MPERSNALRLMLAPSSEYRALVATGRDGSWPRAFAGPARLALLLGIVTSIAATQRVTIRLAVSQTLCWSFVAILQFLIAAALVRYAGRNANLVGVAGAHNGLDARHRRAPPERSGAFGVPASDGVGGAGGAKPPGLVRSVGGRPVGLARGIELLFAAHGPWSLWLVAIAAAHMITFDIFPFVTTAVVPALWTGVMMSTFCRDVLGLSRARARRWALVHQLFTWTVIGVYVELVSQLLIRIGGGDGP